MAKVRNEVVRYETYIPLPSGARRRRTWVAEDGGRCLYRDGSDYSPDGKGLGKVIYADSGPWHVIGNKTYHDNGVTETVTVKPELMTPDELTVFFLRLGWVLIAPGKPKS